jgi:lysozyme family protein
MRLAAAILLALAGFALASPVDQAARWEAAKLRPEKSIALDKAVWLYQRTAARYEKVTAMRANGVPAPVLFCLHMRESDNSFSCSLAQGDPLTHRSRNVPRGRIPDKEPPYEWITCAEDAVYVVDRLDLKDWKTVQGAMDAITRYNGWGPEAHGVPSGYVWAGTTIYGTGSARGKYIADGRWSATAVDGQLGCAAVLKRMRERGISLHFQP